MGMLPRVPGIYFDIKAPRVVLSAAAGVIRARGYARGTASAITTMTTAQPQR